MYHPQVEVFLQRTENLQVAVLGSLKTPGRYMLANRTDSIMTMISRAGGLNDDASTRIMLFPAPKGTGHQIQSVTEHAHTHTTAPPLTLLADNETTKASVANVSEGPLKQAAALGAGSAEPSSHQFVIDLSRLDNQRYLEMSARPGDVIVVPAAGEVTVQGWVDKPGAFKITPGLTVLGSIAAAGGPNFGTRGLEMLDRNTARPIMNTSSLLSRARLIFALMLVGLEFTNQDVITGEIDGVLVPSENVEALAHAMERLMGNEDECLRSGTRAIAITERFGLAQVAEMWRGVFSEVLS